MTRKAIIDALHAIIDALHAIIDALHAIIDALHAIIDALHAIIDALHASAVQLPDDLAALPSIISGLTPRHAADLLELLEGTVTSRVAPAKRELAARCRALVPPGSAGGKP